MGNRLSKIYTKTGDQGTTGLGVKERISKRSLRIQSIGDIDELNSVIGLLIESLTINSEIQIMLRQIQHDLFDLGGELAMPGYELIKEQIIDDLELHIDKLNSDLPPLKNFILPGGNEQAARCHVARAVCRRVERTIVSFNNTESTAHIIAQKYLNGLSDLLFVTSRQLVKQAGNDEVLWQTRNKTKADTN